MFKIKLTKRKIKRVIGFFLLSLILPFVFVVLDYPQGNENMPKWFLPDNSINLRLFMFGYWCELCAGVVVAAFALLLWLFD